MGGGEFGESYNMKDVIGRENLIAHGLNQLYSVIFPRICTLTALDAWSCDKAAATRMLLSQIKQVLNSSEPQSLYYCQGCGTGEINQGYALLMTANKPEIALYRAPTITQCN